MNESDVSEMHGTTIPMCDHLYHVYRDVLHSQRRVSDQSFVGFRRILTVFGHGESTVGSDGAVRIFSQRFKNEHPFDLRLTPEAAGRPDRLQRL